MSSDDRRAMEVEKEVLGKCEDFIRSLQSEHDVSCSVLSIMINGHQSPVVYHTGDQLDYTELVVHVAMRLRGMILGRLGVPNQ